MTPGSKVIVHNRHQYNCEEREGVLVKIECNLAVVDFDSGREWVYKANVIEVPTPAEIAELAAMLRAEHLRKLRESCPRAVGDI